MHDHRSPSTHTDPSDVDLAATRLRFLVAREQCSAQASTSHIRSMASMRWRQNEHHRAARANG
jgi:hypothetical protein